MISLRADEHRYLVAASGRDEALVRQIPGCRYVASLKCLQLPRQPGAIVALDRLFGEVGWEHSADLAQEVMECRGRQLPAAQHSAVVTLTGNELAIECAFADKELVKLVPGYRWSAPQRRWFLPASPMALDLLREHFGALLEVDEAVAASIDLKRADELDAVERAAAAPAQTTTHRAELDLAVVEPDPTSPSFPAELPDGEMTPGPLLERLDRLASAVEELVSILKGSRLLPAASELPTELPAPADAGPQPEKTIASSAAWRQLLGEAEADPAGAMQRVSAQLQLAALEDLPALRAVAGIASSLAGEHQDALSFLRKAEEDSSVGLEPDLEQRLEAAYVDSVLALISAGTQPERPVASLEALEELVLAELVHDSGFDDVGLGSKESRDLLSLLMDDQHLRTRQPVLADYCRVLHLVCVARGGRWMAAERVVEMLRHRDLTDDGFALGTIVLANTVFEQPCMEEWLLRWPPENLDIGYDDLRRIAGDAVGRLKLVEPTLGAQAALSVLALISGAAVQAASVDERRELVKLIPPRAPERRYAEFLAAFQLAQSGVKKVTQLFPGYLQILGNTSLAQSAPHMLTVFVNDSGGADSTTRRLAEDVYLQALIARGVRDPATEVMELIDMLDESPRADNLLNELSAGIEENAIAGAQAFDHELRWQLFERTFRVALRAGHDQDSVQAFDRCVRELLKQGELEELRSFCLSIPTAFKPLQLAVGQALLSLQLEQGEEFEAAAELVLRNCNPKDSSDEGTHELRGLALAFPRFREYLSAHLESTGESDEAAEPDFSGRRVLVVGGHEWLRKHAMPTFDRWGLKTTWLDPDSAKNGPQATSLAGGETDLVVINTACISHAASGRVRDEARKESARTKIAFHNSRGLGALLSITREALADSEPPVAPVKPTRASERRKLLR